jgi:hypothetical protein
MLRLPHNGQLSAQVTPLLYPPVPVTVAVNCAWLPMVAVVGVTVMDVILVVVVVVLPPPPPQPAISWHSPIHIPATQIHRKFFISMPLSGPISALRQPCSASTTPEKAL